MIASYYQWRMYTVSNLWTFFRWNFTDSEFARPKHASQEPKWPTKRYWVWIPCFWQESFGLRWRICGFLYYSRSSTFWSPSKYLIPVSFFFFYLFFWITNYSILFCFISNNIFLINNLIAIIIVYWSFTKVTIIHQK